MMVRILVISSCTKKKVFSPHNQSKCNDITSKEDKIEIMNRIPEETCKAIEMYQGSQHKNIVKGIEQLRKLAEVDFYIISAGFGLLRENEKIPAYECSFNNMKNKEIRERADKLMIMKDFIDLLHEEYDLIYLALGEDYLKAIYDWEKIIDTLTIAFIPSKNKKVKTLKANNDTVAKLSKYGFKIHGTIGFKGDLLRIIVDDIEKHEYPSRKLVEILTSKETLERYLLKELLQPRQSLQRK